MARVTVEDCVEIVPNRFELVLLSARRAREISSGSSITVSKDNDKNPVIALREIADKTISVENIKDSIIRSMQRVVFRDEADQELETEFLDALSNSAALNMNEDDEDDDDISTSLMLQAEAESQLSVMEDEEKS